MNFLDGWILVRVRLGIFHAGGLESVVKAVVICLGIVSALGENRETVDSQFTQGSPTHYCLRTTGPTQRLAFIVYSKFVTCISLTSALLCSLTSVWKLRKIRSLTLSSNFRSPAPSLEVASKHSRPTVHVGSRGSLTYIVARDMPIARSVAKLNV